MKSRCLDPLVSVPVVKPVCRACQTFAPDCLAPVGDGALPMCWLCAHHVVDHGAEVDAAVHGECDCAPQDIYPWRALGRTDEEREARLASAANRRAGR